jgi:hypothetical protein
VLYCEGPCAVGFASPSGHLRHFCHTDSRVTAIAGSAAFKIVVLATLDGDVHVRNLLTGALVRRTPLGGEVRRIAVTKNWGYVLALVGGEVAVLSVNGVLLERVWIEGIADWFPFSSIGDADCVAFVAGGRLGVFPAARPQEIVQFHELQARTRDVIFDLKTLSFVVILENGCVNVIPYPQV